MKKTLISLTLAAAGFVALAAPASAHTPQVSHNCGSAGATLTVHLTKYEPGSTVTVNGVKSVFGTADYDTTITLGAPIADHSWVVVIDNRGDGMNKADKYDQTITDTVKACEAASIDLTPQPTVPPKIEYINPATPPCVLDGRYDAHSPECDALNVPVVLNPPEVLDRQPQPPVLAFTGGEATTRAIQGAVLFAAGLSLLYIGRRFA